MPIVYDPASDTSDKYDEVTYEHELYKGIGIDNPALGYVWMVFPSSVTSIKDIKSFEEKLATFTEELNDIPEEEFLYLSPQNLISFQYEYRTEGVGSFTIQLFDQNYTEIESMLLASMGFLAFQYGYGPNRDNSSPWTHGMIVGYSLKFALEGTYITLSGVSQGWAMNVVKEPISYSKDIENKLKNSPTISQFVDMLAIEHGFSKSWQRVIEDTEEVICRGVDLKTNDSKHIIYNGLTDTTFFEHVVGNLRQYANSATDKNKGGFFFYVVQTEDGPVLHFHTANYKGKEGENAVTEVKLFTLHKNKNTVVREFIPNWEVSSVTVRGQNKQVVVGYDPHNKKSFFDNQFINKPYVNDESKNYVEINPDGSPQTRNLSVFSPEGATSYVLSGGPSEDEAKKMSKRMFEDANLQAFKATLEIQGTHQLQLFEVIAVHVYIPKGDLKYNSKTGNQQVHWISGKFFITEIKQSIAQGDFKTTLELTFSGRKLLNATADSDVTVDTPSYDPTGGNK